MGKEKEKDAEKDMGKTYSRREMADLLAKLGEQLKTGQMTYESNTWQIPEQLVSSIKFKEKDGEVVAKIKLSWPSEAGSQPGQAKGQPYQEKGQPYQGRKAEPLSFKDLRESIGGSIKALQGSIQAGSIPNYETLEKFVGDSRQFVKFSEPEWQDVMAEFSTHVEKLQQAVANNQMGAMREEMQIVADCLNRMPSESKKKEVG